MRTIYILLLLLLLSPASFAQEVLEVVLPEGLGNVYDPDVAVNPAGTQAIFSNYDSNKLFVWNLERNELDYTVDLKKAVRYVEYHPDKPLFFVSTEDSVYVYDAKSGKEVAGFPGTNVLPKGIFPFIGERFAYVENDSVKIASYTTNTLERTFSLPERTYVYGAGFLPGTEEMFVSHQSRFSIFSSPTEYRTFKDPLHTFGELWIERDRIVLIENYQTEYTVYDRSTTKILHDLKFDPDSFLAEADKKVYTHRDDALIVTDILSNTEKKFDHPFEYLIRASPTGRPDEMVLFGKLDSRYQFRVFDLKKGIFSDPSSNSAQEASSSSDWSLFSPDGEYVYQVYSDRIQVNSTLSGMQVATFPAEDSFSYTTYPFKPIMSDDNKLLVLLQKKEDLSGNLMCIELSTGNILWEKALPYFTEYIKVDRELNTLEHKSGYKSFENGDSGAELSFISMEDGKTLYSKDVNSWESNLFQLSQEEFLEVSLEAALDSKSFKIDVHNAGDGSVRTELVEVDQDSHSSEFYFFGNTLLAQNQEEIYFIENATPFKIVDSLEVDQKFEAIGLLEQEQLLILKERYAPNEVRFIDLQTKESLFPSLSLLSYSEKDHTALVKDSLGELFKIDLRARQETASGVFLEQDSEPTLIDERYLIFSGKDSLTLYDIKKNTILGRVDGYSGAIEDVGPGGHLYITYNEIRKTSDASLYQELKNGFELPGYLNDLAVSSDNSYLFFDQYSGIINEYDPSGSELKKHRIFSDDDNSRRQSLQFLNDHTLFITDLSSTLEAPLEKHLIFDLESESLKNITGRVDNFDSFRVYDNNILLLNNVQSVRLFNLASAENTANFPAHSFFYSEDRQLLFLDNGETISLYNVALERPEWEVTIPREFFKSDFSGLTGEHLIFRNGDRLFALNVETGELEAQIPLEAKVQDPFSESVLVENTVNVNVGTILSPEMHVYQFTGSEFVRFRKNKAAETLVPDLKKRNSITDNDLFMLEDGILVIYSAGDKILIKDYESDAVLFEAPLDMSDIELDFVLSAAEKTLFLSNSSGEVAFIDFGEQKAMERGNFKGRRFQLKDNFLFANDHGKKLDVYSWKDQKLLYSLLPIKGNNHIIYTPSGYYSSTKEAAEEVKFRLNESYYSFDQFDLVFNRPHLVLEAMGSRNYGLIEAYEKAYLKRVQRQEYAVSSALEEIPVVKVLNSGDLPKTVESPSLKIHISAEDKQSMLSKLFVKVNGNLVEEIAVDKKKYESDFTIALNAGKNLIEVFSVNENGLKSLTERISVHHQPVVLPQSRTYFIGIGVSEYANQAYNLKYAAKDIRDLSAALKERYPDIIIDTLLNEQVTVSNILQLKERLAKTGVNDQVLISFCGHGVLDKELNWYFATSDMDFEDPAAKGLSYDLLESLSSGVNARQKLVTIDACHSGEIDVEEVDRSGPAVVATNVTAFARGSEVVKSKTGGQSTYALMKELFSDIESGNGTVVISASGGMEFAFEDAKYQNGVFTYSLIRKLEESIWNTLKVSELQEHVINEVFKLTRGMQRPTIRAGNLASDWVVW